MIGLSDLLAKIEALPPGGAISITFDGFSMIEAAPLVRALEGNDKRFEVLFDQVEDFITVRRGRL